MSIELVRDVIKALEEELVGSQLLSLLVKLWCPNRWCAQIFQFNEEGDKPVSSVFTAPMPTTSSTDAVTGQQPTKPQKEERAAVLSTSVLHDSFSGPRMSRDAVNVTQEDLAPLMEAMSQDAIDELVEAAFASADLDQDDK